MPVTSELLREKLKDADRRARRNFRYEMDRGPDKWRSMRGFVESGMHWTGDCDDLASTTLDILINDFISGPDQDVVAACCYRLKVATVACPQGAPYDHMVAGVKLPNGEFWIIGDTFGMPLRREGSAHHVYSYSRVSDGVLWRVGEPW